MGNRLRQTDSLSHALAISGDFAIRRLEHVDSLERGDCQVFGFLVIETMNQQKRLDEVAARQSSRERIELRAEANLTKKLFRPVGWYTENANVPARRLQQAGHQVHQRRFACAVR